MKFSSFGLSKKATAKTSGATFPALTIKDTPIVAKQEYGFNLNPAALELLGNPERIDFSFEYLPQVFIAKVSEGGVGVRGNGNFASKPYHTFITEKLALTGEKTYQLNLVENEDGLIVAELVEPSTPETIGIQDAVQPTETVQEVASTEAW